MDDIDSGPPVVVMSSAAELRFLAGWYDLKRIGWLFGLLLANSFVLSLFARVETSPWAIVVGEIGSAVIVVCFVLARPGDVLRLIAPKKFPLKSAVVFATIATSYLVLMAGYMTVAQRLGIPFMQMSAPFARAGWPFWSVFVLFSVTPAIFEELAFRGIIQSSLERVVGAREAWLIQGALFSTLHLLPLMFISHFVMGLCFGYLRQRFGNLYPGMLLHASWNLVVLLLEWR
jgi:membrane protease YdiL (CAAX protease family)